LKTLGAGNDLNSILDLRNVRGANTGLKAQLGIMEVNTRLNEIRFDRLDKRPGIPLQLEGLSTNGDQLVLRNGQATIRAARYSIVDQDVSRLDDLEYRQSAQNGTTRIRVPALQFIPFVESYIAGKPRVNDVIITKPRIEISSAGNKDDLFMVPDLEVNSLVLENPDVDYRKSTAAGEFSLQWNGGPGSNHVKITGLNNRKESGWDLSLRELDLAISGLKLLTAAGKKFNTGSGSLSAVLKNIRITEKKQGLDWEGTVSSLRASDILMDSIGKKKNRFHISKLLLRELGISTASIVNLDNLTRANSNFRISQFNGEYTTPQTVLQWFNARMSRPDREIALDSFSLQPRMDRDSFFAGQKLQKDYLHLETGPITLSNADIERFIRDNTISGSLVEIEHPSISVYRDTRIPRDSTIIKPLPVNLFRSMKLPLLVEKIRMTDGSVNYTEMHTTGEEATVPVRKLNLEAFTVKNFDIGFRDSLSLQASGVIFDSAAVWLQMKQSYADSLSTFLLNARFSPFRIGLFNPVAMPLGLLEIRSGELDTAVIRVMANEYMAYGDIRMYYDDLKIRLFREGEGDKNKKRGMLSFLANTFVIRNKNDSRTGTIFLLRNRNRSVLNYLVKITIRGFQSSIGIGNNRRLRRQYENEIKRRNLPGLHFEAIPR
jgi:hypothetical protein